MNHASKKIYHIFTLMYIAWEKNKHKLDDFFLMIEVNPTFVAKSETTTS